MSNAKTMNIYLNKMNVDTDGDGLCDYVEKEMLGTDYQKKDTDGDGLNDYSEVYLCDTDPLNADTGKTGVKDSLKDTDGDKLTNAEEIKLGTSPTLTDTDEDGLNDYDEVNKHRTDPLKEDTDGDGISDNGEIKLGLDPLKIKSDGKTSDAERTFEQKLNTDSEMLKIINGEENPYELSVFVKAAGYVDESVSVDISAYSNYLQNDAVTGDIIDIDYVDAFKVEALTINFTVPENADNYYIFRYFEDVNMLLPVETKYDGNRVYTESTEDGTYCIVDMDKWIDNTADTSEIQSANAVYNAVYASSYTKSAESLEVYFLIYVKSVLADGVRNSIANASRVIIDYCNNTGKDIKIYFASYTGSTVISKETGNSYVSNGSSDDEIKEMLSRSGSAAGSLDTTNFNYSLTRTLKNSLLEIAGADENSKKYCFVVDVNFQPSSAANVAVIDEMKEYGVDFSFICNDNNDNIANYESLSSDGSHYRWIPDFSELIINKVTKIRNDIVYYNYETGIFGNINLNREITYDWYKAAKGQLTAEEIKKLGLPDSDGDGKYDFEEIIWDYATIKNGQIIFPTFEQLCKNNDLSSTGIIEFLQKCKLKGIEIDIANTRVVLLRSNPTMSDSDYDGTDDMLDDTPSREGSTEIDASNLDDSEIFHDNTLKSIDVKQNGEFKYMNLEGSNTIKKPVVTYTRYADSKKRTLSKYRILYSSKCTDYKITVKSDYKNKFNIGIFRTIDATKSINYDVKEDTNNNTVTYTFSTLSSGWAYEYESSPSWEYYIELYISPDDDIPSGDNKYTICFEEDNWIYAPNGGVAYNDAKKYSAVYLKDEALRVLADYNEEDWKKYKDKKNFSISIAAYLGEMFYSNNEQYLGMANDKIYQTAGDVSTIATYCGFILSIGSNIPKIGPIIGAFADIATATGVVTTYIASFPVGRQDFEDNIKETLSNNCSKDMSISLHKYQGFGEQFESNLWSNDYVYRYYILDNSLKTILRTDFKSL